MNLAGELKKYSSISIVGSEKNTGKTVTLNYLIKILHDSKINIGVTSIGIDGESTDQVTKTKKPEIILGEGDFFATSEKHYKSKKITSEIFDISDENTSIGRVVTAKAKNSGKVIISGPQNNLWIKKTIDKMKKYGADTVLVDGAISRLSHASPAVTEAVVFSTGAAFSLSESEILKDTIHRINLSRLDKEYDFNDEENGVYIKTDEGIIKTKIKSLLMYEDIDRYIEGKKDVKIYTTGAVTDSFLKHMTEKKYAENLTVVADDFTKFFISPQIFNLFLKSKGKLRVLKSSKIIAVTVNPVSPSGYTINTEGIISKINNIFGIPVFDVMKEVSSYEL